MPIVMDSCCFMNGLMGIDEFATRVIGLQSQGKVKFALSEDLLIEYIFVPFKIAELKLENENDINKKQNIMDKAYKLSKNIAKTICNNSEIYKVTTTGRFVLNDPSDDKLIHLAIDANCPYLVTSNSKDFWLNEVKSAKTAKGIEINIMNPYQFYTMYQFKHLKYGTY